MINILTFGTFDLFHIGHLKILERCKEIEPNSKLIVGVSTDELNYKKKNFFPIYKQSDRLEIVKSIKYVDIVFFEESLELKREYLLKYNADILVMGDDWKGKFDEFADICKVVYLPRTPDISTTEIKEIIQTI